MTSRPLQNAPSLIEELFPAQRISVESHIEQSAAAGKLLTALGSYWKGRKPLVLARACILGALLPATGDLQRDLQIFEMLMGLDEISLGMRCKEPKPAEICRTCKIADIYRYFDVWPANSLPQKAPFNIKDMGIDPNTGKPPKLTWRKDVSPKDRRRIIAQALPKGSYRDLVAKAKKFDECPDLQNHIWDEVNEHLGTTAKSLPQLIEQLGIMRFGHTPRFADAFCGSGQIPFEAARLGCRVFASDLNPIACLLTSGAFDIVGATPERHTASVKSRQQLAQKVKAEIDALDIETRKDGARAKAFLYCVETICPQSGWRVPILPSRVISEHHRVIAVLVPNSAQKRYDIIVRSRVSDEEMERAKAGTFRNRCLVHAVDKEILTTRLTLLRGDFTDSKGVRKNKLRQWQLGDFTPREDDIYGERLYAIQWQLPQDETAPKSGQTEFCGVTPDDEAREERVKAHLRQHLAEWQERGWIPDTVIEPGENTDQPIWERGWTHWHHLFNPRQLLLNGLYNKHAESTDKIFVTRILNYNSRLSRWNSSVYAVIDVFYNQALNTFFNYGCRSWLTTSALLKETKNSPVHSDHCSVENIPAGQFKAPFDLGITDPPYGDAVRYEEILEFFIAWLKKAPPEKFEHWIWDSRRALAIQGTGEDFRSNMIAAYKNLTEHMADNGIQIVMFTHTSGSIWSDMTTILWASGLRVTAAWYVRTETDSALRKGLSHVKGTVILVLRKRDAARKTFQDDLVFEIEAEVKRQIETLVGLNQLTREARRGENLFEDADLQMAGYAAALRILTNYEKIDGSSMIQAATRPKIKGQRTLVDELIDYAVGVANNFLIPRGLSHQLWKSFLPGERFYLKMLEQEAAGINTLENYQNFAKVFKVQNHEGMMGSTKANAAGLKTPAQFGKSNLADLDFATSALRCLLYAITQLSKEVEVETILHQLDQQIPKYSARRGDLIAQLNFLAEHWATLKRSEAGDTRVLSSLIQHQKL